MNARRVNAVNEGVTFGEVWASHIAGRFGSQSVNFIGLDEFIRNKRASGRSQDFAAIDELT